MLKPHSAWTPPGKSLSTESITSMMPLRGRRTRGCRAVVRTACLPRKERAIRVLLTETVTGSSGHAKPAAAANPGEIFNSIAGIADDEP
jgi:hypothetical protein